MLLTSSCSAAGPEPLVLQPPCLAGPCWAICSCVLGTVSRPWQALRSDEGTRGWGTTPTTYDLQVIAPKVCLRQFRAGDSPMHWYAQPYINSMRKDLPGGIGCCSLLQRG